MAREKLIALLQEANAETAKKIEKHEIKDVKIGWEFLADHLIANGVTIPTRCKDCKYKFSANGHNKDGCPLDGVGLMHDDDFCSCGDEKGEAND